MELTENSFMEAVFKVNNFEGSLSLLLKTIHENGINVYDVPAAGITGQYLSYLDCVKADLDNLSEFYSLAATLLCIKSRMLLPQDEVEGEDGEIDLLNEIGAVRDELIEHLIEYHKYKRLSDLMAEQESAAEWIAERPSFKRSIPFEEEDIWQLANSWDLMNAFSSIMSKYRLEVIYDLYEEVSVSEKLALIDELIEQKGEFMFSDLITRRGNPMDVICAFMAVLEAVKSRAACIWQSSLFSDIKIKPRQP